MVIGFSITAEFNPGGPAGSLLNRWIKGNPYRLDDSGSLHLPGLPPIHLAGLHVEQAKVRLRAEPALANVLVSLNVLPLDPLGVDALERFGYDFFRNPGRSPRVADVPVPVDYIIGPGDQINVQLFGNRNKEFQLVVNRDGVITFPQIGPISVAGLSFESLRREVALRVAKQMIGVRVSVTLDNLRSIRVFVLGEVERPGLYTVSGFSTAVNVLLAGQGVKETGSLRRIEVRRNGRVVSRFDLYDLLLRGDTRGDTRIRQGDVVFVPPVGDTVAVYGEVNRPAIYEIRGKTTVADLIALAGGRLVTASADGVRLTRVETQGSSGRDVGWEEVGREALRNGDIVQVPVKLDKPHHSVRLSGRVQQSGIYEWTPGMWLTDLLPDASALKPGADVRYLLVRRKSRFKTRSELLSPNLAAAWRAPRTVADVKLLPGDTVLVFPGGVSRKYFAPEITGGRSEVSVLGAVAIPGAYPRVKGMRVSDLIRASGGLKRSAHRTEAELARYVAKEGGWKTIEVDLAGVLAGHAAADIRLQKEDQLTVKIRSAVERRAVIVTGRVRFPGRYYIDRGERLSSVLRRAGGLTDDAFPLGSIFLRADLRKREQENLQRVADRFETELASVALGSEEGIQRFTTGQALLNRLRSVEATGRLVIDLPAIIAGDGEKDIVMQQGDHLLVPETPQEVSVVGEVQRSSAHLYIGDLDRDDYIRLSGGLTDKADAARIYIVRANGGVVAEATSSRFFYRSNGVATIQPGDSIIVPLDAEYVEPVRIWTLVAELVQSFAVSAAAINAITD